MAELNRREFVIASVATACAGCLCGMVDAAEAPATRPSSGGKVDVGTKADYPKDGTINDKWYKTDRVIVVRNEGHIYAINSTCTHRNFPVKQKDGEIVCPNHGSRFSLYGTPTKGPAKRSLTRYGISLNAAGHIIVDKSKQFEEKKWDDAGAFIDA